MQCPEALQLTRPTFSLDAAGHGTHVAGTIAAINNNKGVKGVVGVASQGARIHAVNTFEPNGYTIDSAVSIDTGISKISSQAPQPRLDV